jgi:polysaccharide biosynthesis protein PslH
MRRESPGAAVKILLVTARYPWPPRRGDQLRAVEALASLAPELEVTVLTPAPPTARAPLSLPADLPCRLEIYRPAAFPAAGLWRAARRGLPLECAFFGGADLSRQLRRLAPEHDAGLLQLARLAPHADDFGDTPFAVDLIDSLSLNLSRRADFDPWLAPGLRLEAALLLRAERFLARRARRLLVVAERDRTWLAGRLGADATERLAVVPLAVPAVEAPEPAGEAPRSDLVLTGNLGYFVNADAARWFLREVWPGLRARRPSLTLTIAGDRPGRRLVHAARENGVRLVPSPSDLRSWIVGATVALAPMRAGSGVPVKILEAWAAGTPVVASPWAAAGTTAEPGRDLLVATSPREWIETLLALLDDPGRRQTLAEGGRRRLAAGHAPEAVGAAWRQEIDRLR